MRIYQTLTEHNIAQGILPYFPHTSMNSSEIESKRINQEFSFFSHASSEWVGISLDFSSWNTRFRDWLVKGIFQKFDQLFGLNQLFTLTHKLFECCRFFINEPGHPPEFDKNGNLISSNTCWLGQKGGCEGLRQKGWTVVSSSLISAYSTKNKYHTKLIGAGDNQVLQIQIPQVHRMETSFACTTKRMFIDKFLNGLEEYLGRANLTLNPDECFSSSHLFVYGKKYFKNRVELPASLKHMSTICGDTNQSLPSSFNMIATAFTGGQDAASRDYDSVVGFTLACFWTTYILHSNQRELMLKVPLDAYRTLWTWPAATNGLPLISFPSFRVRGIPDHLTESYSVWRYMYENFIADRKYIARVARPVFGEVKPIRLMKDPTSVPFKPRVSAESMMSEVLLKNMDENTNNPFVRSLLDRTDDLNEQLASDLWKAEPCFPRLAAELHRLSTEGMLLAMRSSFSRSSSVIDLLRDRSEAATFRKGYSTEDIPALLQYADGAQVGSLIRDLCTTSKFYVPQKFYRLFAGMGLTHDCPCQIAQCVRRNGWGREILGVSVSMPVDAGVLRRDDGSVPTEWEITVIVDVKREDWYNVKSRRGQFPLYFGSTTSEKFTKPLNPVSTIDTTQAAAVRIVNLVRWTQPQSDKAFIQLMRSIASDRLGSEVFPVEKLRDVYGGSLSHRLKDAYTHHHGVANTVSHASTFTSVITTGLEKIKEKGEDRNFFIQHHIMFCTDLVFYSHLSQLSDQPMCGRYIFDLGKSVDCCLEKVDDFCFSLDESLLSCVRETDPLIDSFCLPSTVEVESSEELTECIAQFCSIAFTRAIRSGAISQSLIGSSHKALDLPGQGIVVNGDLGLAMLRSAQSLNYREMAEFFRAGISKSSSYMTIASAAPGVLDALEPVCKIICNSRNLSYLLDKLQHLHTLSFQASGTPRGVATIIFRTILHFFAKIHSDITGKRGESLASHRLSPLIKLEAYSCDTRYLQSVEKLVTITKTMEAFNKLSIVAPSPKWSTDLHRILFCKIPFPERSEQDNERYVSKGLRMTQAGRVFGRSSTAPTKMIECVMDLERRGFSLAGSRGTIMSCCEGAGSCLRCLSQLFPRSSLVYNSLQSPDEMTFNSDLFPAEAMTDPQMHRKMTGCDARGYPGDVCSKTEIKRLSEAVNNNRSSFFIMTSDAEHVPEPEKIFESLLEIMRLCYDKPKFCIWKTFNHSYSANLSVAKDLTLMGYEVWGFKPLCSEYGNGEHYLLAGLSEGKKLHIPPYTGEEFNGLDSYAHFTKLSELSSILRHSCHDGFLSTETLHRFGVQDTLKFTNPQMRASAVQKLVRDAIEAMKSSLQISVHTALGQLQISTREGLGWIALRPLLLGYMLYRKCKKDKIFSGKPKEWNSIKPESIFYEAVKLCRTIINSKLAYVRLFTSKRISSEGKIQTVFRIYVGIVNRPSLSTNVAIEESGEKKPLLGSLWSLLGIHMLGTLRACSMLEGTVCLDEDFQEMVDEGISFDSRF
eukprot:GHVP01044339.1.p1 GENE.GHVP01044339.1~~GHVP01044339.1.p1  ORF type:complete len:1702 (-),score=121.90 GHVP01044339.1:368-4846(-)